MNQIKYLFNQNNFNSMPGSPLAYWASSSIIYLFKTSVYLKNICEVKKGVDTGNNDKYLRLWHEISAPDFHNFNKSTDKWVSYVKGGDFRRWYGNYFYVVYWQNNGRALKNSSANLRSPQLYFKKTITWSALTSGIFNCRVNDSDGLFDSAGSSMYTESHYDYLLGLLNTKISNYLFEFINPTLNYGAGTVGLFPVIIREFNYHKITSVVDDCIAKSTRDWDSFETSWDFKKHPLI